MSIIVDTHARTIDPDDVSHCPIPDGVVDCTLCDSERRGPGGDVGALLEVVTASTPLGVGCFVVCDVCARGPLPALPIGRALRAVTGHAEHLGADLDEIAAAAAAKDGER